MIRAAAIAALALALAGCGSSGGSDSSGAAESYVRDQVVTEINNDPAVRREAQGPDNQDVAKAVTVLCGSNGQPAGTYVCDVEVDAAFNSASIGKETWQVHTSGGSVSDGTRTAGGL